jgi:hypothetical protein
MKAAGCALFVIALERKGNRDISESGQAVIRARIKPVDI